MRITGTDLLMKDKKAAKLIIKRAKKHPDWYTESDIKYAKMVRRRIKEVERLHDEAEARLASIAAAVVALS